MLEGAQRHFKKDVRRKGEEGEERGEDNGREGEHKKRGEKIKRDRVKLGEKRGERKKRETGEEE